MKQNGKEAKENRHVLSREDIYKHLNHKLFLFYNDLFLKKVGRFGKRWGLFGEKWGRFGNGDISTCCR
jgi:hypothetical protein